MYLLLYRIRSRFISKDLSMEKEVYEDENLIHITNEITTILDMEDGVIIGLVVKYDFKVIFFN